MNNMFIIVVVYRTIYTWVQCKVPQPGYVGVKKQNKLVLNDTTSCFLFRLKRTNFAISVFINL